MKDDTMCQIPVQATFTIVHGSSTPVMTSAEYADIPADAIARFLLERCGYDAIFGGEAEARCQRRCDFVIFRRTGNVRKWRVKVCSL